MYALQIVIVKRSLSCSVINEQWILEKGLPFFLWKVKLRQYKYWEGG